MKLYLAPGSCSLADHIALHEAGLEFDRIRVDLRTKRTESGDDFNAINPKGYVPALVLDDGQLLTENVAILYWVAERAPKLAPTGELGRIRLIEMLAFIATELHKPFVRVFFPTSDAEKEVARKMIRKRLRFPRGSARGDYLFGSACSVADAYLYVMLRWARMKELELPEPLPAFFDGWRRGRPCSWRCSTKAWPEELVGRQIDPQHDPKAPAPGPDGGSRGCRRQRLRGHSGPARLSWWGRCGRPLAIVEIATGATIGALISSCIIGFELFGAARCSSVVAAGCLWSPQCCCER